MKLSIKATSKESKKAVIKSSNEYISIKIYNQNRDVKGVIDIIPVGNTISINAIEVDNIPR